MRRGERWLLGLLLTLVWVGGGLALDREVTVLFGALISVLWLGGVFTMRRTIVFPRSFGWFGLLVGVTAVSLWWSADRMETLKQLLLVISGGLWWVGARTIGTNQRIRGVIRGSIMGAGLILTGLWLLSLWGIGASWYGASSLVVEASAYKNHNHLGDWWMLMLTMVITNDIQWQWVFPGMVMLWMSRSRSADMGLLVGWGYLAWLEDWWTKHRKKFVVGFVVVVGIFMITGLGKLTLGSRDYYIQVIAGLKKYPLGTGWGNFGTISQDPATHWWGRKDFSSIVHSLPLEWLAGMGWLGLVGWVWVGLVSWEMGKITKRDNGAWRAAYWALLINFCLDTTYFIPSMWWVWMMVMGLSEE